MKKVKKDKIKTEVVKKESDNKRKLLSNKVIAILYMLCSVAWIVSGILYLKNDSKLLGCFDLLLGVLWFALGVLYFIRDRKSK